MLVKKIPEENVLIIRNRLTCHRTDIIYGDSVVCDQELQTVYPVLALKNLVVYLGLSPFTNDTLSKPEVIYLENGFWGRYENVPENWMAFVDNNYFGIAVYNPLCTRLLAGM